MYQYLKYQWNDSRDQDDKVQAYHMLTSYVKHGLDRVDRNYFRHDIKDEVRLRSKYNLKQGMWLYNLQELNHNNPNPAEGTLGFFREAKEMDDKWYKSWHEWAMMNLKAAQPEKLKSLKDELKVINERIKELQGVLLDMDDDDEEDLDDDEDDMDSDDEVSEGGHDRSIIRLPDPSGNGEPGSEEPGNGIIPLPPEPTSDDGDEEDLNDDEDDMDSDDKVSAGGHNSSIIRHPDPSGNGEPGSEEPGNGIIPLPREPTSDDGDEEDLDDDEYDMDSEDKVSAGEHDSSIIRHLDSSGNGEPGSEEPGNGIIPLPRELTSDDGDEEDLDNDEDDMDSDDKVLAGGHDSSIIRHPDPSGNGEPGSEEPGNGIIPLPREPTSDDGDEEDLDDDEDDMDSDDKVLAGGHDSSIIRLPDPSGNGEPGSEEPGNGIIPLPREPTNELENEELQQLLRNKDRLCNEIGYKYTLITAAISGFIESITLSLDTNLLQDILRLLTLWFTHGSNKDVNYVLKSGVMRIPIKTWMQVIPQLIARIDMPDRSERDLIHQILNDIGREHPQALIYPLSVAERSSDGNRGDYAGKLLDLMREHTPQVVQEGIMFSNELIRIAISWNEQWHEALEKASSKWFQEKNAKGMLEILSPLHKLVKPELSNPEAVNNLTDLEKSFKNVNGSDLAEAYDWCKQYNKSKDSKAQECIGQAWDCYFRVFKRIGLSINSMNTVRLEDASPILLHQARNMELVVPGTYDPGQPIIKIHSINPSVGVIKSKMRPRKLSMIGSNGKTYTFLLKGNEDLRLDERAMQLFGLVNSLLAHSQKTAQQNLSIQRYSVIPLSPHSGLSGWRPHSDTLRLLIKEHRERNKVTPTLETKLCQKFCFCYEKLPLMMKIEVFEEVLNITTGEDLALILYQRSPSAEVWFERRKNYILSHAVMSMVGYILGLGDRHPGNIMMDRKTGNGLYLSFHTP